jgi:hypothetical protein
MINRDAVLLLLRLTWALAAYISCQRSQNKSPKEIKLPVSELPRSPSAIPNRLDMDGNDGLLTSSTGGDGGD